jgi:regulator of protease activity HflC (stomatin/prohibitin superfamily)
MSGDDWSGAVKALSETAARDVVGRYDLEQIVAIANQFRVDFKEALKQQINRVTKDFMGVDVIAVDVGKIKVPEDAEKRLLEKRVAEWDKGIGTTKAETERIVQVTRAMTRMQTIQAISQGLRQLLGQQATPGDLIAMRFIEYLEKKAEMPDATGEDDIATLLKLQGINSLGALRSNRGRRRKR